MTRPLFVNMTSFVKRCHFLKCKFIAFPLVQHIGMFEMKVFALKENTIDHAE